MASTVPAALKAADITRYAVRAAQLEKVKPPVAYWCYYWIVNRILAKGLHTADEECTNYTTELMDKLELMKSQYATNDAIHDDLAGQAYIEEFGLETFSRADNTVRANKASKQTAETFQAAATFLELVHIWGSPSQEITAKIKYAKFHALRIAKALKAGEDPNSSNPEAEPPLPQESIELDPDDPEVQKITQAAQQPSVENAPDEDAPSYHILTTPAPANGLTSPPDGDFNPYDLLPSAANHHPSQPPQLSQTAESPPAENINSRQGSVGGGYFPINDHDPASSVPDPDISMPDSSSDPLPTPSAALSIPDDPQDFYSMQSPPPVQSLPPLPPKAPIPPPVQPRAASVAYSKPAPAPAPQLSSQPHDGSFLTDDDAVFAAQKHAKFAISALNFEDVNTAVKELRAALQSLGAR